MDDEFFSNYSKTFKKKEGIPGLQMNAPLAVNSLVGKIGLELELEGRRLPNEGYLEAIKGAKTKAGWRVVPDGSLRNGGMEYILSTPCVVEELKPMLDDLFKVFKLNNTVLENSNRCSTHVHINIGGKTVNEITSVIALWSTFEELLINWCGEERQTNHFALSTKDAVSLLQSWESFLRFGKGNFAPGLKYSGLNILPIWDKGSIEFRTGAGSNDPEMPRVWATFLHYFVEYACRNYKNPMQIAYDMSERGGFSIFEAICEEASLPEFRTEVIGKLGVGEFDDSCIRGFRNAQAIVLGYPWDRWLELINKEFVPNPFSKKKSSISTQPLRNYRLIDVPPEPTPIPIERPLTHRDLTEMVTRDRQAFNDQMAEVNAALRFDDVLLRAGINRANEI